MIKLTRVKDAAEHEIYLSPEHIIAINDRNRNGTEIETNGGYYQVYQSPSEVAHLITEYKQRQMRLQAAYKRQYRDIADYPLVPLIDELESEDRGE